MPKVESIGDFSQLRADFDENQMQQPRDFLICLESLVKGMLLDEQFGQKFFKDMCLGDGNSQLNLKNEGRNLNISVDNQPKNFFAEIVNQLISINASIGSINKEIDDLWDAVHSAQSPPE